MNTSPTPTYARRRWIPLTLLLVLAVASGLAAVASSASRGIAYHVGPEGVEIPNVPDLASAASSATGAPVDGITCRPAAKETVNYHIHVHVAIFVDGQLRRLPGGVGITRPYLTEHLSSGDFLDVGLHDCLYWLHTHVPDGIVHVETPAKGNFTLGQFFDIWRQPLSSTQVGPARGPVVVFENGHRYSGNPRDVPLLAHGDIQIDVGAPVVAFQPFSFSVKGLCGQGTSGCAPGAAASN